MPEGYSPLKLYRDLLVAQNVRPVLKRDYVRASEIGGTQLDTWLSMRGLPHTNPKTHKDLLTFAVGNAVEEAVAEVFVKAGVGIRPTEHNPIVLEEPNLLPVHGREDVLLEVTNWGETKARLSALEAMGKTPKEQATNIRSVLEEWQEAYPEGLQRTILEIKSCNSQAFETGKRMGFLEKYPQYAMQLFTYMRHYQVETGHLFFVDKDKQYSECVGVARTPRLEDAWSGWLAQMTRYHRENLPPPLPNAEEGWRITYSPYKDLLTRAKYNPKVISDAVAEYESQRLR